MDVFCLSKEKLGGSFREVEAKEWLGLREYQVRDKISLKRDFILVCKCLYIYRTYATTLIIVELSLK